MEICPEKLVQILLSHFGKCLSLVPIGRTQTIPVQRAYLPIEDLKLACLTNGIYEPVREAVWQLRDYFEGLAPVVILK